MQVERCGLNMTSVEIRINDVLGAAPGIAAVLLFGSAVRGRLRPDSDIDVAALFEHDAIPGIEERLALRQRLEEAVQRDVDLIVLNDAPTILAFQALRYGRFSDAVARAMQNMCGFQNIAVHDYRKLSLDVLKSILVHHLTDLEAYYREILALLPQPPSDQPVE